MLYCFKDWSWYLAGGCPQVRNPLFSCLLTIDHFGKVINRCDSSANMLSLKTCQCLVPIFPGNLICSKHICCLSWGTGTKALQQLLLADAGFVVLDTRAESNKAALRGFPGLLFLEQSWQQQDRNWRTARSNGEVVERGKNVQSTQQGDWNYWRALTLGPV